MRRLLPVIFLLLLLGVLAPPAALLADERPAEPDEIIIFPRYPDMILTEGDTKVDLEVTLLNVSDDRLRFTMEVGDIPEGWEVVIWELFDDYLTNSFALEPGSSTELLVRMRPPEATAAEVHGLTLRLRNPAGDTIGEKLVTVTTAEKVAFSGPGVLLDTDFIEQSGPPTARFEFDIRIRNAQDEAASFNLIADPPENWEVAFIPTFDTSKVISGVSLNANGSQRANVRVTPPPQADAGQYLIRLAVFNEDFNDQLTLRIALTGKGELTLATKDTRLNASSIAGKESTSLIHLSNSGTGTLAQVSLLADAPGGWAVQFEPESIALLEAGETVDVAVTLTPASDAIPGDYFVALHARTLQASNTIIMRVDVVQATIWRWFGLGVVIIVLAGLIGVYARLSRR